MFYDKQFLFYEEWTEEASELYIQADRELLTLCSCCPGMEIGKDIIPVLDYYESRNAVELTKKIQSIPAFHGVKAPMTLCLLSKLRQAMFRLISRQTLYLSLTDRYSLNLSCSSQASDLR